MQISANLGFLFTEHALPDAVRAAARAGFDAVEFHFPYDTDAGALRDILAEVGRPALALNTWPGDRAAGDFGLAALPGRRAEARDAIDRAVDYAAAAGVGQVHVMAGRTDGDRRAEDVFRDNLRHACARAGAEGLGVLIEPINTLDVAGYHLNSPDHASDIIAALDAANLRMMLDCYHMGRMGRDVQADIRAFRDITGHIQVAAVPDRGPPDHGDIDYAALWPVLEQTGLAVGAEYRPAGRTEDSLAWLTTVRAAS